ncbi:hypothetical protein [Pseudomonas viridiflava]|uniref:hypothetical protein n=1 Tax=Pseudomonas viridiflava TaxID=33069 RepID=UPI000C07F157|nr:hypothetical protein [Pseudomonas viridiflava]PHN61964.1 hypothetical protein AO275_20760 [Pseudomonas viridiflava]
MTAQQSSNNGESNRIKHALHHAAWVWGKDSSPALKAAGTPVVPTEYLAEMKHHIFCPECCCPLYRSPEEEDANKRGRNAYFGHRRGIKTECSLRTKPGVGKRYDNEEDASQAVINGELVIVESFMQEKPASPDTQQSIYDDTRVEDVDGEPTEIPIARHVGRKFTLPSKITSVAGLCRNFDKNYYKYYFFPGAQHAILLMDAIRKPAQQTDVTNGPIFLAGRITHVSDFGKGRSHNVRFVYLKFDSDRGYKDFTLKMTVGEGNDHKIDKHAVGRVVLAWGEIKQNGVGLSIDFPKWGEVALLPVKYESLVE